MNPRDLGPYFNLAQVGVEMVAPIVLGVALDLVLGWLPWLTILGAVLGFVLGMLHLMTLLKKYDRKKDSSQPLDQSTK
jgi:F0F1-type ATP synthase assembly protein I